MQELAVQTYKNLQSCMYLLSSATHHNNCLLFYILLQVYRYSSVSAGSSQ